MADLKSLYLFYGTDMTRVGSARKRIISRAKSEGSGPEVVEGDGCTPSLLADQILAAPLSIGRRYIVADGVETFKAGELKPLEKAVSAIPEDTTLVMLGRGKAVARLVKLVEAGGGEVRKFDAPKPWEMPDWVIRSAKEIGMDLDRAGAEELVACVGTSKEWSSQERLVRELEKIETAIGGGTVDREQVRELASGQTQFNAYEIGGALLSRERERALRLCDESLGSGEDTFKLVNLIARQLRNVLAARNLLESGHAAKEVQVKLRLSPYAVKHVMKQAKGADVSWLKQTVSSLAELEYSVKGGGSVDSGTSLVACLARAVDQ